MPRSLAMDIISAIASAAARNSRHSHSHPEGPDVEREFEVAEFDRIEIAAPVDVDVDVGSPARVHASGPPWALDSIRVEAEGGRLFIGCDGDCDGDVSLSVSVPTLRGLRNSGSRDDSVDKVAGD